MPSDTNLHTTLNQQRLAPPRVPKLALSVREAGAALGLSPRTVEELVRLGQVPVVRIGRRVLLPVAGLRRWLERSTEGAMSEVLDERVGAK